MEPFIPADVKEAAQKLGGDWISPSEFDGEGLVLKVVKPLEKIKASKFGAEEKDFLVEREILEVGETFRFTFQNKEGVERKIDTKSAPLFLAFKNCEDLGVGDEIHITRTGKTSETRYTVEKVSLQK